MHDTVQAVLRDPVFHRSLRRSLADRILVFLGDAISKLARAMHGLPSGRTVALGFAGAIVLFVLVRFVVAASARGEAAGRRIGRGTVRLAADPWQAADDLLARGEHEAAAHALYRGVIQSLAQSDRIRLDPSKTSGDYSRELRRRSSKALSSFVMFSRRFDVLVYGHVPPDATAVEQLRQLAGPFRSRSRAA